MNAQLTVELLHYHAQDLPEQNRLALANTILHRLIEEELILRKAKQEKIKAKLETEHLFHQYMRTLPPEHALEALHHEGLTLDMFKSRLKRRAIIQVYLQRHLDIKPAERPSLSLTAASQLSMEQEQALTKELARLKKEMPVQIYPDAVKNVVHSFSKEAI